MDLGPKFIVFVAGGVTYSEIRGAYDLSKDIGAQIIIGSHGVLTSSIFIDELKNKTLLEEKAVIDKWSAKT